MKYFLTSFFTLLIFVSIGAFINASILPPTWTKGFSISLYEGSGMLYRSNNIFLSLDSCVLSHMENGKTKTKKFMFSAQEFDQILKKMKELKADEIRSNSDVKITYDKGSTSLCFTIKEQKEVCVGEGATKDIYPADKQRFHDAYKYLHEMVDKKTGKNIF